MKKESNIILRVDSELKDAFFKYANNNGFTVSALLNACMADLVRRKNVPIYLYRFLNVFRRSDDEILNIKQIKEAVERAIETTGNKEKINKVYLFGSYSRGEATSDSDVDFRIEVNDDFSLFDLSRLIKELKAETKKDVDVATQDPSEMDEGFYNNIRKEEICIYELSRQSDSSTHQQTLQ